MHKIILVLVTNNVVVSSKGGKDRNNMERVCQKCISAGPFSNFSLSFRIKQDVTPPSRLIYHHDIHGKGMEKGNLI